MSGLRRWGPDKIVLGLAVALFVSRAAFATVERAQDPGAEGPVAGHVPDQLEQASSTPASARASGNAPPRWWAPGDGRMFPAFIAYDDLSALLALFGNRAAEVPFRHEPLDRSQKGALMAVVRVAKPA